VTIRRGSAVPICNKKKMLIAWIFKLLLVNQARAKAKIDQ